MKKRLKIMFFVDTYYPVIGGVNTVVDKSCSALSKWFDITLVAVKHHSSYIDPPRPYKIIRCKGFYNKITNDGIAFPFSDKYLVAEVKTGNYDIFHSHQVGPLYQFALKMGKKLNIPVISSIHTLFYYDALHYLKSKILAKAVTKKVFKEINKSDYIWAVTKFCKKWSLKNGITKHIDVVYNAIDLKPIYNYNINKINRILGIGKNTFIASSISRIEKTKNLDLILESALLLNQKYKNTKNIKFLIVGDGKYLKRFKLKVAKHNLDRYFIFTGMVKDRSILTDIYSRTDVALFPSIRESAGLLQIEAAAYSVPTIVIKNTAPSERIKHNFNGFISNNSSKDFLNNVLYAYNNKDETKKIGIKAKETLYRTYDDERIITKLKNKYKKIYNNYKLKGKLLNEKRN